MLISVTQILNFLYIIRYIPTAFCVTFFPCIQSYSYSEYWDSTFPNFPWNEWSLPVGLRFWFLQSHKQNTNHPFILQFLKFSKNILSIAISYLILSFTFRLWVFHYFIVSLGWILERQLNTSLCPSCLTDTSISYHSKIFEKVLMFNNKKVA